MPPIAGQATPEASSSNIRSAGGTADLSELALNLTAGPGAVSPLAGKALPFGEGFHGAEEPADEMHDQDDALAETADAESTRKAPGALPFATGPGTSAPLRCSLISEGAPWLNWAITYTRPSTAIG